MNWFPGGCRLEICSGNWKLAVLRGAVYQHSPKRFLEIPRHIYVPAYSWLSDIQLSTLRLVRFHIHILRLALVICTLQACYFLTRKTGKRLYLQTLQSWVYYKIASSRCGESSYHPFKTFFSFCERGWTMSSQNCFTMYLSPHVNILSSYIRTIMLEVRNAFRVVTDKNQQELFVTYVTK